MSEHFNRLTPAQAERLHILAEEAAEVVKAAMKILRHGYESRDPTKELACTNRFDLEREIGDFSSAVNLLEGAGDISGDVISIWQESKPRRRARYMHHQTEGAPDGNA